MMPTDVSTFGLDRLLREIFAIVGFWLILAEAALIAFVLRFRHRKERQSSYLPGSTWRSACWVLVPAALVMLCDLYLDHASASLWHKIKVETPPADYHVRVRGKQFFWEFLHPGADGELDTEDDVRSLNHLYVPVDRVVRYELTADDVLHSLFIPNLRLKQDAVPGRVLRGWFQATRPGDYQIVCAELCGVGHSMMRATLHVLEEQDFVRWQKEAKQ